MHTAVRVKSGSWKVNWHVQSLFHLNNSWRTFREKRLDNLSHLTDGSLKTAPVGLVLIEEWEFRIKEISLLKIYIRSLEWICIYIVLPINK